MRAVVAVLLFVIAAHAALWGIFQQKQQAPDFQGILPSASYAPFASYMPTTPSYPGIPVTPAAQTQPARGERQAGRSFGEQPQAAPDRGTGLRRRGR